MTFDTWLAQFKETPGITGHVARKIAVKQTQKSRRSRHGIYHYFTHPSEHRVKSYIKGRGLNHVERKEAIRLWKAFRTTLPVLRRINGSEVPSITFDSTSHINIQMINNMKSLMYDSAGLISWVNKADMSKVASEIGKIQSVNFTGTKPGEQP